MSQSLDIIYAAIDELNAQIADEGPDARGTALADEKWRDPANWRLPPAEGDNFWT